jgi:hypothetical protein
MLRGQVHLTGVMNDCQREDVAGGMAEFPRNWRRAQRIDIEQVQINYCNDTSVRMTRKVSTSLTHRTGAGCRREAECPVQAFLKKIRRDGAVNSRSMLPTCRLSAGETLLRESTGPKGRRLRCTLAKAIGAAG